MRLSVTALFSLTVLATSSGVAVGAAATSAGLAAAFTPCVPSSTVLCLDGTPGDGRFEIRVTWHTMQGGSDGQPRAAYALSTRPIGVSQGGLFYFADQNNPEMLVKVLDGCTINERYWFFSSAGTNVGLETRVTDLSTGTVRTYSNQDLNPAIPVQDVEAFTCTAATPPPPPPTLVGAGDIRYLGAFRLPGDAPRPKTFEYGGGAMTYSPAGDPSGPADGFPGSLFIAGHDRMPYGELPDGDQIAEVAIPAPVVSKSLSALPTAGFLQDFREVTQGLFPTLDEIPRLGMQYLNHALTGPRIHLCWGAHFQEDERTTVASHAWFSPTLEAPSPAGAWWIGTRSPYSVNGYMLDLPADWAAAHTGSRLLGTGRFKDGGWSGMGPALFAYQPWQADGSPPPSGSRLAEQTLLLYASSRDTESIEHALNGYQHPDAWEGAAFVTTASGKSAVLFAGTKGTGDKYWYGYVNPGGASLPCVHGEYVGQFPVCRLANGAVCPPADLVECAGHTSERGWWSSRFDAQLILYDPAELARVAAGEIPPWQPQPYAVVDVDPYLLLNPDGVEVELIGAGSQQRYRLGDATFDRSRGLLYVLELFADQARPVVHVFRVQ